MRAPTPAGCSDSMTIWYFEFRGKVVIFPSAMTSSPSCGLKRSFAKALFQMQASMQAF